MNLHAFAYPKPFLPKNAVEHNRQGPARYQVTALGFGVRPPPISIGIKEELLSILGFRV